VIKKNLLYNYAMQKEIEFNNNKLSNLLRRNKLTISAAESCTGGLFSSYLTDISGASEYFLGSLICYSNQSKIKCLGVSEKIIEEHGAVSRQTAEQMARGLKNVFASDIAISVTGIAGPGGGSLKKPVGLIYICVLTDKDKCSSYKFNFKGSRLEIKKKTVSEMISLTIKHLSAYE
jgi:nicotinamide-nucleotide amidase